MFARAQVDYEQLRVVSEENGRNLIEYENRVKELERKYSNNKLEC